MPSLNIIIPFYQNKNTIEALFERLQALKTSLQQQQIKLLVTCVDDGSTDGTWEGLTVQKNLHKNWVHIIKLIKNFGSSKAILAGFKEAVESDSYACLAADLQDPPELLLDMVPLWQKGMPLIIAHRNQYNDGVAKSMFSKIFHSLLKATIFKNAPTGGFDLMLFDKKIHTHILNTNEKNTHIMYWVFSLGYPYAAIPYNREQRADGSNGQWTLQKKVNLFVDTFTSFTYKPLRFITMAGFVFGSILFIYGLIVLIAKLVGYNNIPGWSATMFILAMMGSFQLFAIGIIGEYVWRIVEQVRNKPTYIVEKQEPPKEN
jgi:polyisoprenyl-phosphate glycosyltransferase